MAYQCDPTTIRIALTLTIEDAAKLRTYIRGKTVPAEQIGGKKVRKTDRAMRPSDFFVAAGRSILDHVKPCPEDVEWSRRMYAKRLKQRKAQDEKVASGAYRKPHEQWLKPGRKAGVVYPAYEKAMSDLRKRRSEKKMKSKEKMGSNDEKTGRSKRGGR